MNTHQIIKVSREKMPSSCFGAYRYYRIAILEVDEDHIDGVSMISERAKGVISIVREWRNLYKGTTDRCAFARAMTEALELVE